MIPAVIPFFRHRDKLDRCLTHLARQTRPVEPVVIDNNETNRYFTVAVNEGLRRSLASPSPYYLIMNQDMYLAEDAVERLVSFMEAHPRCGIASPLQLSTTSPGHVDFAGATEAFPLGFYLNGPRDSFREDREVHWAGGGCLMLRAETVREIGLLDPNMRFLGSDADYCFTARARGVVGLGRGGGSRPPRSRIIEIRTAGSRARAHQGRRYPVLRVEMADR